jgi:hypothetical protein
MFGNISFKLFNGSTLDSSGHHGESNNIFSTTIINITVPFFHFFLIGIGALITMFFPIFWLIFIMPLTVISLILVFPCVIQYVFPRRNLIVIILNFLIEVNVFKFLTNLHSIVFYTKTKIYIMFVIFCYGLTIFYILVSRYNFYHKIVLRETFSFSTTLIIGVFLFIGLCGSYLRILINLSNIVVLAARAYVPEILDPILKVEPADYPINTPRNFLGFSKHTHNHNHYHPPQPKTTGWSRFGVIAALGTLAVGSATYYHTRLQTAELQKQTQEFKRQNDLEELSQSLMTKEEYHKRNPKT